MIWFDAYVKEIYEMLIFLFQTHLFNMRLNAVEQESFRKWLKFFFQHFFKNP